MQYPAESEYRAASDVQGGEPRMLRRGKYWSTFSAAQGPFVVNKPSDSALRRLSENVGQIVGDEPRALCREMPFAGREDLPGFRSSVENPLH